MIGTLLANEGIFFLRMVSRYLHKNKFHEMSRWSWCLFILRIHTILKENQQSAWTESSSRCQAINISEWRGWSKATGRERPWDKWEWISLVYKMSCSAPAHSCSVEHGPDVPLFQFFFFSKRTLKYMYYIKCPASWSRKCTSMFPTKDLFQEKIRFVKSRRKDLLYQIWIKL